jgi:hypothetical protein
MAGTRNWNENPYYKLNKDAEKSINTLEKVNREILKLSKSGKTVGDELRNSFTQARLNVEKYAKSLEGTLKYQQNILKSTRGFTGLNPRILQQNMGFTISNSKNLLNSTAGTLNKVDAETKMTNSLNAQTRLEMAQLGSQIIQTLTQGFEQAYAIIESKYKTMAGDALQNKDWLTAKDSLLKAHDAEDSGSIAGSIGNIIGNTAATSLAGIKGGPWGMLAAGAFGFGASLYNAFSEYDARQERQDYELKRAKEQMIKSTDGTFEGHQEAVQTRNRESLLKDPETNLKQIKADEKITRQQADSLFKNASILAYEINSYQEKNNSQGLTDIEVQRLLDLNAEYDKVMAEYKKFDQIAKSYENVIKSTEAAIEAKEREREKEEQAKTEMQENLDVFRSEVSQNNARKNFAEALEKNIKEKGEKDGFNAFYNNESSTEFTALKTSIEEQKKRAAELTESINFYKVLETSGVSTSEQLKHQLELERELESVKTQISEDEELLSGNKQREEIDKAYKDDYKSLVESALNSKYLAQDFGSFSRYFGKTDPSIAYIKETNNLLRELITTVENSCTSVPVFN